MSILDQPLLTEEELRAQFSENALTVLRRRYLRRNEKGEPAETISEMFRRVARHVAQAEAEMGGDPHDAEERFYRLLTYLRFIPNSPTFTGAGTPLGQLAACFVLPIKDDMGRIEGGIFQTLRDAALIQQTGGGNGFSFSRLRPKDALVKSSMGKATGPLGFLHVYDVAFGEIAQGGTRRGANMGVLRIDHPDIESFITSKTDENAITNFNISVGMLDAFMEAVEKDEMWPLRFPDVLHPKYRNFHGTLEDAEEAGIPIKTYRKVRARELFQKIVHQAWRNGEPGMLFLDTANRDNPVPHLGRYESTNPCGEQFLLPYESCCLGSINLARHLAHTEDGRPTVDWAKLAESVHLAVRFLDDVVEANGYVPAVPQLKEAAQRSRRIGLGIMGLADLLFHMRIPYGSEEGQEIAAQLMEFIRYEAMLASIDLASRRGPFATIKGSLYDPDNVTWRPPAWPEWLGGKPRHDWGRPPIHWERVLEGLRQHGIRNAAQLTIAPTGTIATVAGAEGYGCEPVFALAYTRNVHEADRIIPLRYVSKAFTRALEETDLDEATREAIFEQVALTGSCQQVEEVPEAIRRVFVVASDVPAEGHVRMQAALQIFVDASISKTINFPADATEEDVANAFKLAWKLGCKGLTVYVAGSREHEVLETEATRKAKNGEAPTPSDEAAGETTEEEPCTPPKLKPWEGPTIRPRPPRLVGRTYRMPTPVGAAFITINSNGHDQPFEVFINVAKAGSETAAMAEAIGRLISLVLRLPSAMEPIDRLEEVTAQLRGIGGGRPLGFGHNRVLSLPDGVARAIQTYLEEYEAADEDEDEEEPPAFEEPPVVQQALFPTGDLCPVCGQPTMVYTEGCRRCYSCGHSEC